MKYYAVTDDPTELMHYGIKGMKWGVIRTDAQLGHPKAPARTRTRSAKPRSPAYQKASAKLSSAMQRGIAKAQANWKTYNSPQAKAERKFEKHVQLARQGRLKYKGISDKEVQRITDRLMLENRARQQSGNEKQSFRRRLTSSVSEGIIKGAGEGTGNYIRERMTAAGRTAGKIHEDKRMAAYQNSLQGRLAQSRRNRAESRKTRAQAQRDFDKEYYKMQIENGEQVQGRAKQKAKAIGRGSWRTVKGIAEANAKAYHDHLAEGTDYTGVPAKEQWRIAKESFKNADWHGTTKRSRAKELSDYRARQKASGAASQVIREGDQSPPSNISQTTTRDLFSPRKGSTSHAYHIDRAHTIYRVDVPNEGTTVNPKVKRHAKKRTTRGRR